MIDRARRGRRLRRRARAVRVAVGAAPLSTSRRRRPHRGRHGRRRRRLLRPAARRVRRPAARRPADGAGRPVRRRRVGADLGARSCSTASPATGELHGHAVGNLLIVGLWELLGDPVAGLDWVAGCSARRAGCCRWRRCRSTSRPRCAAPIPAAPTRSRRSAARSRSRPRAGDGRLGRAGPGRPAGLPGGGRGDRRGRLGGARTRDRGSPVGDPAPAGARAAHARCRAPARSVVVALNLAPQRARHRASPGTHLEVLPSMLLTCGSTSSLADRARWAGGARRAARWPSAASGRSWCSRDVAAATGRPRHDPLAGRGVRRDHGDVIGADPTGVATQVVDVRDRIGSWR